MMKKLYAALCILICLSMLPIGSIPAGADGSHGFFMDCDSSVVGGKSDGFMIDFYSDSAEALCTYFSNANWSMYTDATAKKYNYKSLTGGGAYAGLQILDNTTQRRGIMSFWRYDYVDGNTGEKKHLYAEAVYGKTTTYDNEGSGTSCVMPFPWESSRWYRQLLFCWRDAQTGHTYMGTWFYDYEEDKWSLFAYYDTKLINSYIVGDIGQFLENFSESQGARYRSFRYRNIYFLSHDSGQWVSSPTVNLRSDGNSKAFGEAKLGVSEDNTYVWASVDGKSEIDTDHQLKVKPTLTQADTPSVGAPSIGSLTATPNSQKGLKIRWQAGEHSTPQLSYTVKIYNQKGERLTTRMGTRPEVDSVTVDALTGDAYRVELTVTDVFGQSTSESFETEAYKQSGTPISPEGDAGGEDEAPVTTPEIEENHTEGVENSPETDKKEDTFPYAAVIGGAAGGVVVTLAILFLVGKKRRRNKG